MKKDVPCSKSQRMLTDFTDDAYRLILEQGQDNLDDYETHFQKASMQMTGKTGTKNLKPV